jgi:abortive infection phage resistance-like protein
MEATDAFYRDFQQEILGRADANEDFIESEFVEYVAEFLIDSGEVESFDYCQHKAERGIRVDGYNLVEENGVLNLFVSDFRNREELTSLTKTEINAAFRRLENFFRSLCVRNIILNLKRQPKVMVWHTRFIHGKTLFQK